MSRARIIALLVVAACCSVAVVVDAALQSPHRQSTRGELAERERLVASHPNGPLVVGGGASKPESSAGATCQECFYFFDLMDDLLKKNTPEPEIERAAELICTVAGILTADVCNGIIVEFAPEFIYLMNNTYRGHSKDICWVLGICHSSAEVEQTRGWQLGHRADQLAQSTAPHLKPTPADQYRSLAELAADPNIGTFLQLTDLHVDMDYVVGTNTRCGRPTCCHSTDGIGVPPNVSGIFGDYHCDGAPALQDALMTALAALEPKPDFIVWTGDEVPDNVWAQSQDGNLEDVSYLANRVSQAIPGVKAYPTVGNHEPFPIAQLDGPDSFGGDGWLYRGLGAAWSSPTGPDWLDAEATFELQRGGYYSQLVRPGLRLISLNTQHGTKGNYWLLMNQTDPAGQLEWFSDTLALAANHSERVYIICHIPFGNEMQPAYSASIHERLAPYANAEGVNIVAGLFFGHTHMDSIQVRRDYATDSIPLNIGYVAPSITPQTNINPSYRIYYYDRTTFDVVEYVQYTADLVTANANGYLTFEQSYVAREAYNMTGLTPADWQQFVNRLYTDSQLLDVYIQNHVTKGRDATGCANSSQCRLVQICDAASFTPDLFKKCMNSIAAEPPRSSCSDLLPFN